MDTKSQTLKGIKLITNIKKQKLKTWNGDQTLKSTI